MAMSDAVVVEVAADGSPWSQFALEWALDEAQLRGCAVELVGVYFPCHDYIKSKAAAETAIYATIRDAVAARAVMPVISWKVVAGDPEDVRTNEFEHSELVAITEAIKIGVEQ
jgi:nucleotide-binding universal stress UspA family protein